MKGTETDLPHQTLKAGAQLNPDWVEWLMGWPIGWTALAPLEGDAGAIASPDWWAVDPAEVGELERVGVKIPDRVSRLKSIGNGQVPAVAALAFQVLMERMR
jgi:hypothetical protein